MLPKALDSRFRATSSSRRASRRRGRRSAVVRLRLEQLESRCLLSGFAVLFAREPNDTLDAAQALGNLTAAGSVAVVGQVGNGTAGAADVDWFQFTLTQPGAVTLRSHSTEGDLVSVLGLYNSDPWAFSDPENGTGHRLLAQAVGTTPNRDTLLEQALAPGTYWLAVSGAGNRHFHPFLANSGHDGSTGDYELSLAVRSIGLSATDPAVAIASTPANGSVVAGSPLVVRVAYSAPLDTGTIDVYSTLLIHSPTANVADPNAVPVLLSSIAYSEQAMELQLNPASPLKPGHYFVLLPDPNGNGDPILRFQVTGVEAGRPADDSRATANELGTLRNLSFVQTTGAIGDDSSYDPNGIDPFLLNPASDVDFYHFRVTGGGRYAFVAEVFAGRIGSRLDPGVSLFRLNPATGQLDFIEGNDNTLNDAASTNGMVPLYTDAVLYAGLTAGDYYLAVSGAGNTPQEVFNFLPGVDGIFDPNSSHSGLNGGTIGQYVLNVSLRADNAPPRVVAVTPARGTTLSAPPTRLTVRFSEAVNLLPLAYEAFLQTSVSTVAPVWVEAENGTRSYPRLEGYDTSTNQATFLMLDGLANGNYELHLSGALGLVDFAGRPLVGNDASGDYVVAFSVNGPERGTNGDPLTWASQEPNDDAAQDLGVLFPHELQAGITVTRDHSLEATQPQDVADGYRLQVLQNRTYVFLLNGEDLPEGVSLTLLDDAGNVVPATVRPEGDGLQAQLAPGTYVIRVGDWTAAEAGTVSYVLSIALAQSADNPTPLTIGPRPASGTSLAGALTLPPLVNNVPTLSPTLTPGTSTNLVANANAAALIALLVSSPVSFSTVDEGATTSPGQTPLSDTGEASAPNKLPVSLLSSLGAGAVGGMEEAPADKAVKDTAAAPESTPLPEELVPQPAEEAVQVPPEESWSATGWLTCMWEAWGQLPRAEGEAIAAFQEAEVPMAVEVDTSAEPWIGWAWVSLGAACAAVAASYRLRKGSGQGVALREPECEVAV